MLSRRHGLWPVFVGGGGVVVVVVVVVICLFG